MHFGDKGGALKRTAFGGSTCLDFSLILGIVFVSTSCCAPFCDSTVSVAVVVFVSLLAAASSASIKFSTRCLHVSE